MNGDDNLPMLVALGLLIGIPVIRLLLHLKWISSERSEKPPPITWRAVVKVLAALAVVAGALFGLILAMSVIAP